MLTPPSTALPPRHFCNGTRNFTTNQKRPVMEQQARPVAPPAYAGAGASAASAPVAAVLQVRGEALFMAGGRCPLLSFPDKLDVASATMGVGIE